MPVSTSPHARQTAFHWLLKHVWSLKESVPAAFVKSMDQQQTLLFCVQVVVRGLQDPEAIVRGQAAFALGQLAEYCQPDINEHYKELLPGVFHVMHDPTPQVQQQACYALDAFCENLGRLPESTHKHPSLLVVCGSKPDVPWMIAG